MSNLSIMEEGKTNAIISHFWIIGTLIALVLNNNKKNPFASFYIRQMMGIHLASILNGWFVYKFLGGFTGWCINIVIIVLWIISFIGVLKGEKKIVPIVGEFFQNQFKSI
ncbi:hypothetical protein [Tenacibaculum halocynthiae]|uniref:hypothetical protein n=1 Tax=Tenacibaculum halocynthiae TaxID=1254437 RepID=UPI003D64B54E